MDHFSRLSSRMSYLAIRPCSGNASSESGDGIVTGFQSNKKYRKNSDSNQTKKSRNQRGVFSILLMSVTNIQQRLLLNGIGMLTTSDDGSIWTAHTARWTRTIWNPSCGFSVRSGRRDTSTKGSASHGIHGNSRLRFPILKSRWTTAIRMCRIQRLL